MDAQELRIGNYVYAQSGKLVVNRDSIYKVENVNIQSARKYEPIPLTEEWLLEFGFRRSTGEFKLLINNKKGMLSVILRPDGIGMIGVAGPWGLYDSIHYKYVHQLQNLFFSLCGEELQLK